MSRIIFANHARILYAFSRSAANFLPTSIAGLQLWLDAADSASITQTANAVSQWNDKSGNSNHATQATGLNQPLTNTTTVNSKNALLFNGTVSSMTTVSYSHTQPMTRFMVARLDAYNLSGQTALSDGGGQLVRETSGFFKMFAGLEIGATARNLNSNIHINIFNSTTSFYYLNGALNINGNAFTNATAGGLTIMQRGAGGGNAQGACAEVIEYSGTLTNAQLNQVGNYLAAKWGITWTTL